MDSATFVQLAPGSCIIHLIYVFVLVYARNGRFIVMCVLFFAQTISCIDQDKNVDDVYYVCIKFPNLILLTIVKHVSM